MFTSIRLKDTDQPFNLTAYSQKDFEEFLLVAAAMGNKPEDIFSHIGDESLVCFRRRADGTVFATHHRLNVAPAHSLIAIDRFDRMPSLDGGFLPLPLSLEEAVRHFEIAHGHAIRIIKDHPEKKMLYRDCTRATAIAFAAAKVDGLKEGMFYGIVTLSDDTFLIDARGDETHAGALRGLLQGWPQFVCSVREGLIDSTVAMVDALEKAEKFRDVAPGTCIECGQPFSDKNVFTMMGWRETRITRLCEKCFDAAFAGVEDEEEEEPVTEAANNGQ